MDLMKKREKNNYFFSFFISISSLLLLLVIFYLIPNKEPSFLDLNFIQNSIDHKIVFSNNIKDIGAILFTKYLLPFEMVGVLLLTAMLGIIVISKNQNT